MSRSRHTAGLQCVGQVLGIFNGEVTGDRALSTVDLTVDTRSRIDDTVEHDGDSLADISFGELSPAACTVRVHGHADLRLTGDIVELVGSVGDDIALQRSASVGRGDLQRVELEDVLGAYVSRLSAPKQFQIRGEHLLSHSAVDDAVDGCGIADAGIADNAQPLIGSLQHGEQRMQLLCLGELSVGGRLHAGLLSVVELELRLSLCDSGFLGSGFLGAVALCYLGSVALAVAIGQTTVELLEIRSDLLSVVGLPKLQVGTTLQQLAHTLGLADTRHLHHDAALSALHFLDVGLYDAELVNTCSDDIEGVVDGRVDLFADDLLHVGIGAGR